MKISRPKPITPNLRPNDVPPGVPFTLVGFDEVFVNIISSTGLSFPAASTECFILSLTKASFVPYEYKNGAVDTVFADHELILRS
jgi:hypothetical protein